MSSELLSLINIMEEINMDIYEENGVKKAIMSKEELQKIVGRDDVTFENLTDEEREKVTEHVRLHDLSNFLKDMQKDVFNPIPKYERSKPMKKKSNLWDRIKKVASEKPEMAVTAGLASFALVQTFFDIRMIKSVSEAQKTANVALAHSESTLAELNRFIDYFNNYALKASNRNTCISANAIDELCNQLETVKPGIKAIVMNVADSATTLP